MKISGLFPTQRQAIVTAIPPVAIMLYASVMTHFVLRAGVVATGKDGLQRYWSIGDATRLQKYEALVQKTTSGSEAADEMRARMGRKATVGGLVVVPTIMLLVGYLFLPLSLLVGASVRARFFGDRDKVPQLC